MRENVTGAVWGGCMGWSRKGFGGEIRQAGTTLSQHPHPHPHPRLRQSSWRIRLKGTATPLPTRVSGRHEAGQASSAPLTRAALRGLPARQAYFCLSFTATPVFYAK